MSEETTVPVWQQSRDAFQAAAGVKRPYIAEISNMQYSGLSKRGKVAYDAKRSEEWQASADCANDYAAQCFAAYLADPSILEHSALARDARDAIRLGRQRADEAIAKAKLDATSATNAIAIDDVKVGDRVFSILGGYGRVTKKNRLSLGLRLESGFETKAPILACAWLHYRELVLASAAGKNARDYAREVSA
jgi:hypothetical protein